MQVGNIEYVARRRNRTVAGGAGDANLQPKVTCEQVVNKEQEVSSKSILQKNAQNRWAAI